MVSIVSEVPHFIEASTPGDLTLAMASNNRMWNRRFNYFDIQYAEGRWIAWYNHDLKQTVGKNGV